MMLATYPKTLPVGVIDGSVLTAVGLLILFATFEKIMEVVKAGRNLKI